MSIEFDFKAYRGIENNNNDDELGTTLLLFKENSSEILDFEKILEKLSHDSDKNHEMYNLWSEKIFKISEKFNDFQKNTTAVFLITSGFDYSIDYVKKFNIKLDNISNDVFMEGFYNNHRGLFFSDYLIDFLELSKNPSFLYSKILENGYLLEYNYLLNYIDGLSKIKDSDIDDIISSFKYNFLKSNLRYKIETMSIYDWDAIFDNIFESPKKAKKFLSSIFILDDIDKKEIEKLKNDILNNEFIEDIFSIKNDLEISDYSIISEIHYNEIENISVFNENLSKELLKVGIEKNKGNSFVVNFVSVGGKIFDFTLTGDKDELENNLNTFYDFNDFTESIYLKLTEYIENFKDNGLDFTVLISKSNGKKDGDDYDGINNIDFNGEIKKVA